ncbi:ABC transporter permease [soil metagenome]
MTNPATEIAEVEAHPVTAAEEPVIAGKSPTQIAFERLRHDKVAVVCAIVIAVLVLASAFAPLISRLMGITPFVDGPNALDTVYVTDSYNMPLPEFGPPSGGLNWPHVLGIAPRTATDNFATLLYGMRNSLFISIVATVITTTIGLVVGLASGFSRGWLDRVLSFVSDLFFAFPFILFAIALAPMIVVKFRSDEDALARAQFVSLIVILSILSWMGLARLIRGQVFSLREREFVLAAQVIGASTPRILFKEIMPNLVATMVVVISMSIPGFIAAEVGLSFLGLGLTDSPSMGQMIQAANPYYDTYPLYLWAPVATVVILVLALNLVGDSIRDAFDPKTRR